MFRERGTLLGLLIAAIAGVGSVPFLLQADDPELDLRRRRIEAMTSSGARTTRAELPLV